MTGQGLKVLNMVLLLLWSTVGVVLMLLWKDSLLFVSFMSLYAIVISHGSAYIAARAEIASIENPPQEDPDGPEQHEQGDDRPAR